MQTSLVIVTFVRRLVALTACGLFAVAPGAAETRPKLRDVGTHLAACTTYAALFAKSPVGLKYNAGLPPETARHLQTVAWATVQDYFRP